MKLFEVKGTYKKSTEAKKFTKSVKAESEKLAKEKIFSQIGGKQRIPRRMIIIESVGAK